MHVVLQLVVNVELEDDPDPIVGDEDVRRLVTRDVTKAITSMVRGSHVVWLHSELVGG